MVNSPYDDPEPRGFRVVVATLRIIVAVQCWGAAAEVLKAGQGESLKDFLTTTAGLNTTWAATWVQRGAWFMLATGFITLIRPVTVFLIAASLWFSTVAAAHLVATREWGILAEDTVKALSPLVLLLLDFWPPKLNFSLARANIGLFLLRSAAAVTFIGYGIRTVQQSRTGGPYVELITGSIANVLHRSVSPEQAQSALGVMGGITIGLGLGLLLARSRPLALLMTAWGALTAMSHVLAHGPDAYPAVLVSAAHPGAPFTLFLFWWLAIREQPPIVRPVES